MRRKRRKKRRRGRGRVEGGRIREGGEGVYIKIEENID